MSGFIYIWFDRKHKRYYVGSHWGSEDDGYICSSNWMRVSYKRRPNDFKRRIIKRISTCRSDLIAEENRYLSMIREDEIKPKNPMPRYYNLNLYAWELWHSAEQSRKTVGQKISEAKKGKPQPCTPEKARAISEAKKKSFDKRKEETGSKFTEEHREKLSKAFTGRKHTEEWKQKQSERLKQQWSSGVRV